MSAHAFISAAACGRVQTLHEMLRRGHDVNTADETGTTALHVAALLGQGECVMYLLSANANVHAEETQMLLQPLFLAAGDGHADIANMLIHATANVNATNIGNWTALTKAAYSGHTQAVRLLLSKRADVNVAAMDDGVTPLTVSAQDGFLAIVQELVAASADVNALTRDRWTALILASRNGHRDVVQVLLAALADISAETGGETALTQATKYGHQQVVQMLRDAGGAQVAAANVSSNAVVQVTFSTSAFKQWYGHRAPPNAHAIVVSASNLVRRFAARALAPDDARITSFCRQIEDHLTCDAMTRPELMALRLWTCPVLVQGTELCFMLNDALRRDHLSPAIDAAVTLTAAINTYLVANTHEHWPPNGHCFRGGGLPTVHRAFFVVGKRYRAPAFVASSFSLDVAKRFMARQSNEPILWVLCFDRRCKHVAFIARSLSTALQAEYEFLVAPYTAFEVLAVTWAEHPSLDNPHHITLRVAADNRMESEDLPLTPWT